MSLTVAENVAGKITTHPLPPAAFDPRVASPQELRRHGLPQRPDPAIRPQLAALWDEVFSRELTYITPTFRPLADLVPGIQPRVGQEVVTVTHPFWSGAVVHATGTQKFT